MAIYNAGISWGRVEPYLASEVMRVDGLPGPDIFSFRPIGLGQNRLKWEIVVEMGNPR
jgi:hypothetical protein